MLILPLHQPLTRATFPWITALLVAINVFVFAFWQSGDHRAEWRAQEYYDSSGLAAIESPLFLRHLEQTEAAPPPDAKARRMHPRMQRYAMQRDDVFRARLATGELFDDATEFTRWQPVDAEFQALQSKVFTTRFAFYAEQPRTLQLFSSMFLHGGLDHLLGNMLFLIALGLLVEGPLGGALFVALYLIAGAGAGLAWMALHGGGPGSVIGASGAIAGLMGAFCVLWGRRRVRFFYWLFVVFDYVRAPALVLLPLWLGWEVLQMVLSSGSRVAYSAHAGGIVAGATLAALIKLGGWQREAYFKEHSDDGNDANQLFQQAQHHLGLMQLDQAEHLLATAVEHAPQRFDIRMALFRCAQLGRKPALISERTAALLALPLTAPVEVGAVASLLRESNTSLLSGLPAPALAGFALRLVALRDVDMAMLLFDHLDAAAASDDMPQRWLQLVFALRDGGHAGHMAQALQRIVDRYPQSAQATKARFLMQHADAQA